MAVHALDVVRSDDVRGGGQLVDDSGLAGREREAENEGHGFHDGCALELVHFFSSGARSLRQRR